MLYYDVTPSEIDITINVGRIYITLLCKPDICPSSKEHFRNVAPTNPRLSIWFLQI